MRERADDGNVNALEYYDCAQASLELIFLFDGNQKPSITRPPMTAAERDVLYTHMLGMDEFESKLILHEPPNTTVGPSDTQVFLNRRRR
jgi:hypothetical protein